MQNVLFHPLPCRSSRNAAGSMARAHALIGRAALASLYDELALEPKPGLVSFVDCGSHTDMTAATFLRSIFALRHCFSGMAALGAAHRPFESLEAAGVEAERRMLRATGGVNTHRGAIFMLGLLCAAAGSLRAAGRRCDAAALRVEVIDRWGEVLARRAARPAASAGQRVARQLGLRSAGHEAALGFPCLFEHAYPALCAARAAGVSERRARLHALFAAMAVLADTNLARRGGLQGLREAQACAQAYLDAGGGLHPDAVLRAQRIHADFVARRLSPGGSADLLSAACWLERIEQQHS